MTQPWYQLKYGDLYRIHFRYIYKVSKFKWQSHSIHLRFVIRVFVEDGQLSHFTSKVYRAIYNGDQLDNPLCLISQAAHVFGTPFLRKGRPIGNSHPCSMWGLNLVIYITQLTKSRNPLNSQWQFRRTIPDTSNAILLLGLHESNSIEFCSVFNCLVINLYIIDGLYSNALVKNSDL